MQKMGWLFIGVAVASTAGTAARGSEDGLLGYWNFEEVAGGRVRDVSGNGRDGVVHGAALVGGICGKALKLDGRDDYVALGDLGEVPAATVAFWVKPGEPLPPHHWQGLVSSDAWEAGILHIVLGHHAVGWCAVEVYVHLGPSRRARLSSPPLRPGNWYHVAIAADTADRLARLFLNGLEVDNVEFGQPVSRIKLAAQVIGREFDGQRPSRYFRGEVDEVRLYGRPLTAEEIRGLCPHAPPPRRDLRNIRTGHRIPDEGYCDQPYTVVTKQGHWLCTMTTGPGREGDRGQHIVATISEDKGRSWSPLIDIEPSDGPEASWAMPLAVPSGRVYVFYSYNGDNVRTWQGKPIRADTVGWYCFKYSDDGGRTWSEKRYRLPLPLAPVDRSNTFGGAHQIFWGIGKPIVHGSSMWLAFSRCGALVVDKSEGWFFRSDNILSEPDPERIRWELLPDGDQGLKNRKYGDVHAEQNLVALSDGSLYCMYRTITGYPFHAYSRDGGHTWTTPEPATYTPGGRKMKNPRACPRIWRTNNGNYLFWFHNHSDVSGGGWQGRNPAWISGGVERDGKIHWSQPEILLYDPDPEVRISYPDLIEEDGRYWVTETQKTVARVHEIDPALLEGLWTQGQVKRVTREGLVFELSGPAVAAGRSVPLQALDVTGSGGISVEVWVRFDELAAGQVLLDGRSEDGRGLALTTTPQGTVRLELSDGWARAAWDCDPGLLRPGRWHHLVAIVDSGPQIISFVVDGQLCDGRSARTHGWTRFADPLGDVSGSGTLRLAPSLSGQLRCVRLYRRYLRTSEAVANFLAGP